ncbi:glycosyltransferase 87 family protein [Microbacterium oryzae]|uniref:glycosyltransferase 87 family protein n=1 Tax=Microbacterium oryzae TaxID=743009 RepID=UPI0025B23FE8|nr:glycosyltransferase 87 family protein [Microbacterium oryzae]MDN3311533.1 glycosyltransferase 87 family protein [Microbacterium oryzae]
MPRRMLLWIAFAIVHVWVAAAGWWMPNQPMGDVHLVYEPWSTRALAGGGIVGVTESWVYPQLALVPMVIAHALTWVGGYDLAWALLVALCDAVAFWMLVGRGRSRSRRAAAWFWLAFAALLGPVGMYRIDAITVPLAIVAVLLLARRPALAGALLTAGAWIKIWPAALVAAAVLAMRRRLAVVVGALVMTALVVLLVVAGGGARHLLGFVTMQTGRGLQLEAPVSTYYLWGAAFDLPGWWVFYDQDILTFQVTGPNVDVVIAAMTPVLAVVVAGIAALGLMQAGRGAAFRALVPPLGLALVVALMVCNKVGSPQFHDWLIAPLVLWVVVDRRRARGPALLALTCAALTQLVYPLLYLGVMTAEPVAVTALSLRNVLLVALLAWAVARVARVPVRARAPRAIIPT